MAVEAKRSSIEEIEDLIRAAVPLIYVSSYEEERARWKLQEVATRRERELVTWSIVSGFKSRNNVLAADIKDPIGALDAIDKVEGNVMAVLMDFHPYLEDPVIRRRLRELAMSIAGQTKHRKHVILLSPVLKIPPELEKDLAVVDFDLPGVEEIDSIVVSTIDQAPAKAKENVRALKDKTARRRVVDAALGLTANEIRVVLSKSLVRKRDLDVQVVAGEKRNVIRKAGILEFYESDASIEDIGGLEALKDWLRKRQLAFTDEARAFGLPTPKGVLLIGVPGCLHGDTPIHDPVDGTVNTVKERYGQGVPFHVTARDQETGKPVVADALPPVAYSSSPMLRFTLSNGVTITVTPEHRFMDGEDEVTASEVAARLRRGEPVRLPTSSDSGL